VLLLGVWWACLWAYTTSNRFPYQYHADEGGKVRQVISVMTSADGTGERNFNHPQLLLEATQVAVRWLGTDPHPQAVVVIGRTVSAVCCAVGVVALAWALYLSGGLAGLLAGAVAAGLCPMLLAHSHAMKEDAALAGGLMLTVFAGRLLWVARTAWGRTLSTLLLGFATGAAASGKYVGLAAAAFAVPAVLLAPSARWHDRLLRPLLLVAAMAVSIALINHRVYADWDTWNRFLEGVQREYDHSQTDHMGVMMDRPNGYFVGVLREQTPLVVRALALSSPLVLICGGVAWAYRRRRGLLAWRPTGWDGLVVLFPGVLLWITSYSAVAAPRYALPAVVMTWFCAAATSLWLGRLVGRPWARVAAPLLFAALAAAWAVPRDASYVKQFGDDSRQRLRAWLLANAPRGSTVVADGYAGLTAPPYDLQPDGLDAHVNVYAQMFAPDFGSTEALAAGGVDYVAIADIAYSRFFNPHAKPAEGEADAFDRRRAWYAKLLRDGQPVWASEPDYPMSGPMSGFTNPRIRVYKVPN